MFRKPGVTPDVGLTESHGAPLVSAVKLRGAPVLLRASDCVPGPLNVSWRCATDNVLAGVTTAVTGITTVPLALPVGRTRMAPRYVPTARRDVSATTEIVRRV